MQTNNVYYVAFKVRGTQKHGKQELLEMVYTGKASFAFIALLLEPENKFDPNAIAVEAITLDGTGKVDGEKLGYVPKELAALVYETSKQTGSQIRPLVLSVDPLHMPGTENYGIELKVCFFGDKAALELLNQLVDRELEKQKKQSNAGGLLPEEVQ